MEKNIFTNDAPTNKKPLLALTFDDGPSEHTDRLLDVFRQYGGKGTFFVIGELINNRPETITRAFAEGHEIGNHTYDHSALTYLSDEAIADKIQKTCERLKELLGINCRIVRPPYGDCGDNVKAVGRALGVSFINWSVDTADWKSLNADAVYNEVMGNAVDGAIILCHDAHKTTVDAMERAIPKLIETGFRLVTVTELLSECDGLVPGELYYKR